MRRIIVIIMMLFLYTSCNNPVHTGAHAEENLINMSELRAGMTEQEVLNFMSYPYKMIGTTKDNKDYEIWFYITEPTLLGQTKYVSNNFTPFVFKDGILIGWGDKFYKLLLDIDNAKGKRQEEIRQQYTDDRDEWPPDQHVYIPFSSQKTQPSKTPTTDKTDKIQQELPPEQIKSEPEENPVEIMENEKPQQKQPSKQKPETQKAPKKESKPYVPPKKDDDGYNWWE